MPEPFEATTPNPIDDDEVVWLALSHLRLPPGAFVAHLAEPLLDANDPCCGFVRCNPLLQMRSLFVEREMTDSFAEQYRVPSLAPLRETFAQHEVVATARGFRCGIYTKQRFHEDAIWTRLRELAAAALAESGLPPWLPMPERWSYRPYASWDEYEDRLYGVVASGGRLADLPEFRAADPSLWEPQRR